MSVISVFPKRQLKISPVFTPRSIWYTLAFILALLTMWGFDFVLEIPSLVDDYRLHQGGKIADNPYLDNGSCERQAILTRCGFDVHYRTPDGMERAKTMHYASLFGGVNQDLKFTVSYDPSSPGRVTTSWGQSLLKNRMITQVVVNAFLGFLLWGVLWERGRHRRELQKLVGIGKNPTVVAARISKATPFEGTVTYEFSWTDFATGRTLSDQSMFAAQMDPFWLDGRRSEALAVAGPNRRAQLVDGMLQTIDLSNAERRAILDARKSTVA